MTKKLPDLKLCILLDAVGCLSYAVPFLGEFSDAVWAPLSGIIFYFVFGSALGTMGGLFSVVEELLPGFDFIPTFTISYFIRKREIQKGRAPERIKSNTLMPIRLNYVGGHKPLAFSNQKIKYWSDILQRAEG